jgi:predicted exporter
MPAESRSRLRSYPAAALAVWLAALAASAWLLAQAPVKTDLAAFLPSSATQNQQLLLEQMRSGVTSRIVLIAIEGADGRARADASRALAADLRRSSHFAGVRNGEAGEAESEFELLMRFRYLLSPAAQPERFAAPALRASLEAALQQLATPAGALVRATLARDPTGELGRILERLRVEGPAARGGVWASPDGARALLLAETMAGGFDAPRQQQAIEAVRGAFASRAANRELRLALSGPAVFAVETRSSIERDAWLLSGTAGVLVLVLLFFVYRAPWIVALCMLPAASGILIGSAAVGLAFGSVHAVTIAFGATLIGEAVDYPSYVFTHSAPGEKVLDALSRIWPTLRLAVLTTLIGGLAMALSGFGGLAQLGLLLVCGVLAAGVVTRWVIPALAAQRQVTATGFHAPAFAVAWSAGARRLGSALVVLGAVAAGFLAVRAERIWDDDLASLSAVPERAKALDRQLRSELGAPDLRHLVLVSGATREIALQRTEQAEPWLTGLAARGLISGHDSVARYSPSAATQEKRRAALPEPAIARASLEQALQGLPFQPGLFEPFLRELEQNRAHGPVLPEHLKGSALGLKLQSLLVQGDGQWVSLVPLHSVADAAALAREAAGQKALHIALLDLKEEANALVAGFRSQALKITAIGMLAISLVLTAGLRSAREVARVLVPVLAALALTVAGLHGLGHLLSVFHLIALLLVLGIGLNYALFFNRPESDAEVRSRTLLSVLVCSGTTLIGFGTLATSSNPVLRAIGLTVALGAALSLLASAALARRRETG